MRSKRTVEEIKINGDFCIMSERPLSCAIKVSDDRVVYFNPEEMTSLKDTLAAIKMVQFNRHLRKARETSNADKK